jgi:hypothetical protein|tara:strand:+ start:173 stop:298 length:126 start_codon:yes stop_codon:yes gene_type:complete
MMSDQKPKPIISKKFLLLGVVVLIELSGHGILGSLFKVLTG